MIFRSVYLLLLFTVIHNAASDCIFHLKNIDEHPLIVYKYKPDGTPVFHYPHEGTDCIVKKKANQRIHFACPGPNSKFQLQHVQIMDDGGRVTVTLTGLLRSVYLYDENLILFSDNDEIIFPSEYSILQCLSDLVPKMIKVDESSPFSERERVFYKVSFKLNELDTLNVFEIVHFSYVQRIVAQVRMSPIVKRLHYIKLAEQYEFDRGYKSGPIYQTQQINFTTLYSPEYQKASFQKHLENTELTNKYFSGNNSLVIGQLISAEDMLYAAEHMSTYYYENTVPIWKSVYEGNWKSVGKLIRALVDESVRDMEVYASHFGDFDLFSSDEPWVLGNDTSSQDFLAIPRLLVKVAVDVSNRNRGMVFHTYNDPYLDLKEHADYKFCSKTTDCAELNPQFKNVTNGYTFCCYPQDSFLLREMLE